MWKGMWLKYFDRQMNKGGDKLNDYFYHDTWNASAGNTSGK